MQYKAKSSRPNPPKMISRVIVSTLNTTTPSRSHVSPPAHAISAHRPYPQAQTTHKAEELPAKLEPGSFDHLKLQKISETSKTPYQFPKSSIPTYQPIPHSTTFARPQCLSTHQLTPSPSSASTAAATTNSAASTPKSAPKPPSTAPPTSKPETQRSYAQSPVPQSRNPLVERKEDKEDQEQEAMKLGSKSRSRLQDSVGWKGRRGVGRISMIGTLFPFPLCNESMRVPGCV